MPTSALKIVKRHLVQANIVGIMRSKSEENHAMPKLVAKV